MAILGGPVLADAVLPSHLAKQCMKKSYHLFISSVKTSKVRT
jgi:hypothetical protein